MNIVELKLNVKSVTSTSVAELVVVTESGCGEAVVKGVVVRRRIAEVAVFIAGVDVNEYLYYSN